MNKTLNEIENAYQTGCAEFEGWKALSLVSFPVIYVSRLNQHTPTAGAVKLTTKRAPPRVKSSIGKILRQMSHNPLRNLVTCGASMKNPDLQGYILGIIASSFNHFIV
jgi:hypothetical protein